MYHKTLSSQGNVAALCLHVVRHVWLYLYKYASLYGILVKEGEEKANYMYMYMYSGTSL